MPAVLVLIAGGLTAWVFELGAVLLRRRSVYLSAVAAVTVTLFGLDAWFDVLTASAGADWYESPAAAFFGEVPMTILLIALAIWAPRHCRGVRAAPR